ncbi:MAG: FAD-dependent oxidoreductase, partial [Deltaproteobacteria bacterium]|nr:FAD-dependent oxidoreductase [Deltaproteobacteria bacterium]
YPLRGADVFTSVNPLLGAWCVIEFALTRLRHRLFRSKEQDSFESWVTSRFGRTLYNIYFGPYTKKVWGRDPSQLAGSFASQRIPVLHLWDLIQRTFLGKRGGSHRHNPYADISYYPRKGIGQISDRLTEEVVSNGGKIWTEVEILGVKTEGGKIRSVKLRRGGQPEELPCDFLLSTIPVRELIPLFDPAPPEAVLGAAEGVHYRSARLMYLLVDREQISGTPWIYFSNPEVIFNRIYEIRVFSSEMVPAGKTALCVEVTCDAEDETWSATDATIYSKIIGPLEEAGLLEGSHVYDYFSRCLRYAYPIYEVGFEARMNAILGYLDGFDNVLTYGRQGIFSYTNTDHSIDMGFRAANFVHDFLGGREPGTPKRDLYRDYSVGY